MHRYTRLNSLAMRLVKPGGLLITCSCSGAMTQVCACVRVRVCMCACVRVCVCVVWCGLGRGVAREREGGLCRHKAGGCGRMRVSPRASIGGWCGLTGRGLLRPYRHDSASGATLGAVDNAFPHSYSPLARVQTELAVGLPCPALARPHRVESSRKWSSRRHGRCACRCLAHVMHTHIYTHRHRHTHARTHACTLTALHSLSLVLSCFPRVLSNAHTGGAAGHGAARGGRGALPLPQPGLPRGRVPHQPHAAPAVMIRCVERSP